MSKSSNNTSSTTEDITEYVSIWLFQSRIDHLYCTVTVGRRKCTNREDLSAWREQMRSLALKLAATSCHSANERDWAKRESVLDMAVKAINGDRWAYISGVRDPLHVELAALRAAGSGSDR